MREIKLGSFYGQDFFIRTNVPETDITDREWQNRWQKWADGNVMDRNCHRSALDEKFDLLSASSQEKK